MEETDSPQSSRVSPITFGRTFSDLIVEFKNDSRAMSTVLTLVPFIVIVTKNLSIEALEYSAIVALVLNIVWFGYPLIARIFRSNVK